MEKSKNEAEKANLKLEMQLFEERMEKKYNEKLEKYKRENPKDFLKKSNNF